MKSSQNMGIYEGLNLRIMSLIILTFRRRLLVLENIPKDGRFVFASNHPLGGFDGLLLMSNVHKVKGELRFLVNDILMQIPQLGDVFAPLNKHGGHSRDVARVINEYYSSDIQMLIFPSGLASRKVKGEVVDLEWKKHLIQKSVEYKRDIIPVHVSGREFCLLLCFCKYSKVLRD